jgi:hypothetical protein
MTKKTHVAPTHRHIVKGIDGRYRLWTNISAAYMGAIPDYSAEYDHDYRVLTCVGSYDTHNQAHKALKTIKVAGEWK